MKSYKQWTLTFIFALICTLNAFASPFNEDSISDAESITAAQPSEIDANLTEDDILVNDYIKHLQSLSERTNYKEPKSPEKEQVATSTKLEEFEDIKVHIDGDNYCAQYAMTVALNGMGIEVDENELYQETNPAGIFTAPSTLVSTLRMKGVEATQKHNASIDDIKAKIDAGKPVIVLVDSGDNCPHWICITGYNTDSEGKITGIRMRDAYWGTSSVKEMDIEEFKQRWAKPLGTGLLGMAARYKNLMIDIGEPTDPTNSPPLFPNNLVTSTEDNLGGAINDVVTGWKNKDVGSVIGGASKIICGLPSALVGVASNCVLNKCDEILAKGKDKISQDGIGNKIVGGAEIATATVAKGAATVGKALANIGSNTASVIGNGVKKIFSIF